MKPGITVITGMLLSAPLGAATLPDYVAAMQGLDKIQSYADRHFAAKEAELAQLEATVNYVVRRLPRRK